MRLASLFLLPLVACHTDPADPADPPATSVRERLARGPTRLLLARAESAGTIAARRKISDGWETGIVDLAIDQGEVIASANPATGAVTIEKLSLTLDDIAVPPHVFDKPATFTEVRGVLAAPAIAAATWTTDDDARLETKLELSITWALTIDGTTLRLGGPDLPPVAVAVELGGDGAFVHADVKAAALGELWSWAGLVKLEDLNLVLAADTP